MIKGPTRLEGIVYVVLFVGGLALCARWAASLGPPGPPRIFGLIAAVLLLLVLSIVAGIIRKLRGGTFADPEPFFPKRGTPADPTDRAFMNQYLKRRREAQAAGRCPFCGKPLVVSIDSKGKASKLECPECNFQINSATPSVKRGTATRPPV
jgi:DNA-directed RNA polymerase subunit RPC12/RpoP